MTNNVEGVIGNPVMQFLDSTGAPLVAGTVTTYVAGSATLAATYQDSAGATPNANPIVLDSRGSAVVWGDPSKYYKFVVKNSLGTTIYTADNMPVLGAISTASTTGDLIFVADIAALRAITKPTSNTTVLVQKYYTGLNGGGGVYNWFASSASTDNGGSVINPTGNLSTGRWLLQTFGPLSVKQFGAKGDGTTDDSTAINNTILAGYAWLEDATYRCATGVTVNNSFLDGGMISASGSQKIGPTLQFDLSVMAGLTIGGSGVGNSGVGCRGINVTRAVGTPPVGSIGILVQECYNPTLELLNSQGHSIPWKFLGGDTEGISARPLNCYSGAAYDAHIVVDTWPELYWTGGRIGMNGAGDQNCDTYIRVQGGSTLNAATGPNTLQFTGVHFNQGGNTAAHFLSLANLTASAISDIGEFHFANCHVEALLTSYFHSDATFSTATGVFKRLKCTNVQFNSVTQMFGVNDATPVDEWQFTNCFFAGAFTVNPASQQYNIMQFANNVFASTASFKGNGSATLILNGDSFGGNLTLSGTFGQVTVKGPQFSAGGFVNNAAITNQDIDVPTLGSWTPVLKFGGASTGITYSARNAKYQQIGRYIHVSFEVILTSKGSATGVATLEGLPVTSSASVAGAGASGGGALSYAANMAALSGPVFATIAAGGTTKFNLYQNTAAGFVTVDDTNFNNNSAIYGTLMYVATP